MKSTIIKFSKSKSINMKKAITALFLFSTFFSYGQNGKYEYNFSFSFWEYEFRDYSMTGIDPLRYRPKKQVDRIQIAIIDKKGKEKNYLREFNEERELTSYSRIKEDGKKVPIRKYEYLPERHFKTFVYKKNGDLKYWREKKYIDKNKPLYMMQYNADNELESKRAWTYNEENCLQGSIWEKRAGKIKRRWAYDYYEACKKSETRLYNGKDKLLKAWNYDCKEEGEQMQVKKKTMQYCKWDEATKDYLLKISQSFDEKGRLRKYVYKYDIKDTSIIERTTYNGDDEILYAATYDHSYDYPLITTSYRNGKEHWKWVYQYENERLIAEMCYKKGKEWSNAIQKYEDDQLVFRSYTQKGELWSKHEYKYENELLKELKTYGKKEVLKKTVKLAY